MPTYTGWRQVPEHLLTATQLGELEFPRQPLGQPAAWVATYDWRGKKTEVSLYDARDCQPTKATARVLAAAAGRATRSRVCADCGARCQRPLPVDVDDQPLCPVCRSVVLLRAEQRRIADGRAEIVATVRGWLAWPGAAVVQVGLINPGRTPGGSARPDTAIRVQAIDTDGRHLVDVLTSLVGPKARIRTEGAVPTEEGTATVHAALVGRPLIVWRESELLALARNLSHSDWPQLQWGGWDREQTAAAQDTSTRWRGQLNELRGLVPSLRPGTPDRLLLHLRRIAEDGPAHVESTGDPWAELDDAVMMALGPVPIADTAECGEPR